MVLRQSLPQSVKLNQLYGQSLYRVCYLFFSILICLYRLLCFRLVYILVRLVYIFIVYFVFYCAICAAYLAY